MQDVRIRILSAAILSVVAFLSLFGALLVFIWWLAATHRVALLKSLRSYFPVFILLVFFSGVIEITQGSGGFSYFLRMSIIILIGAWVLYEQKPGEMLGLCVWLFGRRTGFEMGLIAEMGFQSFELLQTDIQRIRAAEKLKGIPWSIRNLVPTGLIVVRGAITRAEDTAELLAIRGFNGGGSFCPEFSRSRLDIVTGASAIIIGILAFVPVSEFFILYR